MIVEIIAVSVLAFLINIPLGRWRTRYRKLSLPWWLVVHASIPILITIRIWIDSPQFLVPLFIAIAILGQFIGSRTASRKIDSLD